MARDKQLPPSKKERARQKQQQKVKKPLAVGRILIVCEGERTEPNYFKWWQKQLEEIKRVAKSKAVGSIDVNSFGDEIKVKGEGKNTHSLVNKAIELNN